MDHERVQIIKQQSVKFSQTHQSVIATDFDELIIDVNSKIKDLEAF